VVIYVYFYRILINFKQILRHSLISHYPTHFSLSYSFLIILLISCYNLGCSVVGQWLGCRVVGQWLGCSVVGQWLGCSVVGQWLGCSVVGQWLGCSVVGQWLRYNRKRPSHCLPSNIKN